MATETMTRLVDDIDGNAADTTVEHEWQGQRYVIGLSKQNADGFLDAIAPYVSTSREVGKGVPAKAGETKSGEMGVKVIRTWAEANGVQVYPRGRISGLVMEQHEAAQ